MMPLHVVIQGPLTSPPTPRSNWPPNLNADCLPAIFATATAVAEDGGTAIVSTWTSEDAAKRDLLGSSDVVGEVVASQDPGRSFDTNGPLSDNRLRQAVSTMRGLEALERRGAAGLVAKVRTDQTIPTRLIRRFVGDFLATHDAERRDVTLFVCGAHASSIYEIDDYVFVGTIPAVRRFFEAQLRLAPFHGGTPSVHGDLIRKHLYANLRDVLGLKPWQCFPVVPDVLPQRVWPRVDARMITPWVQTLLDFVVPLPHEAWLQTTWRGSPPFADWYREDTGRIWFEDRDALQRDREEFFLRRWPHVFRERRYGFGIRPFDYALEVPFEIAHGRANTATRSLRRVRRLLNRRRFRRRSVD
jgi:hypothetical protein